tara:strand:- start:28 stop:630 length:603 start_codon:yes stop_codon:yes gene_type:complete
MVEVVCPLCDEEIDLGVNLTGEYECPYCEGSFEYESESLDIDQIEQYIHEIEGGKIEPDFIIKDYSYTDTVFSKVFSIILSIPFIFLFGIGLIFIYFILKEPIETEYFNEKIIYFEKADLIIFYKTRNNIISDYDYLKIGDDALFTFSTRSVEGGSGISSKVTITCRSTGVTDYFLNSYDRIGSDWEGLAKYRGIKCVGD